MTMQASHLRSRLVSAAVHSVGGNVVHHFASLALSIAAARLLGAVHFGEYAMTRTTLFTATMIAGINLTAATAHAVASARTSDRVRAGRVIGFFLNLGAAVSAIATVACVALARPIAQQLGAPQLAILLAAGAPYVFFGSIAGVQRGILNGLEEFALSGRLIAWEGIVSAALVAAACFLRNVSIAIVAMGVAAAILYLIQQRVIRSRCRDAGIVIQHRGVRSELPLIGSLIVPAMLLAGTVQPFAWFARAMLARSSGGLREVGIFAAAYAWGSAVQLLPGHITRPAMPILTNVLRDGDASAYRQLLRDLTVVALVTAAAAAIPLMIAAPWIMRAYGASFRSGALALTLVAAASVPAAISGALRSALIAAGGMWHQALQSLVWGVTLIAAYVALRSFAANGLAAAYLIAFSVSLGMQVLLIVRALRVHAPR